MRTRTDLVNFIEGEKFGFERGRKKAFYTEIGDAFTICELYTKLSCVLHPHRSPSWDSKMAKKLLAQEKLSSFVYIFFGEI